MGIVTKVPISNGGLSGRVIYDEEKQRVSVNVEPESLAEEIKKYLKKKREFRIPQSQTIDDFEIDEARPVDELTYFELAMCALYSELGVWVDWPNQVTEDLEEE